MHVMILFVGGHPRGGRRQRIAWTTLDPEDYALVCGWRWSVSVRKDTSYVYRNTKEGCVYLHRLLLGLSIGDRRQVDHRDGNGLNNRRGNLRLATHRQNGQNRRPRQTARGVHLDARTGRWVAKAMLNGKTVWLGRHATEAEAESVVSSWRREHMPFSQR